MSKDRTASHKKTALSLEHVPRIVRLIKANPGLTVTEIYNLRNFSFTINTLRRILVEAKARGFIYFDKQGNAKNEAKYYICQTEATIEEVDGNSLSQKS